MSAHRHLKVLQNWQKKKNVEGGGGQVEGHLSRFTRHAHSKGLTAPLIFVIKDK